MIDWASTVGELIGKPFAWGARGPDAYDCWGIVVKARELIGEPISQEVTCVQASDDNDVAVKFKEQIDSGHWRLVDNPMPGDIVVMTIGGQSKHVGIWTPIGVLHTSSGYGAVITLEHRLKFMGFKIKGSYRWVK